MATRYTINNITVVSSVEVIVEYTQAVYPGPTYEDLVVTLRREKNWWFEKTTGVRGEAELVRAADAAARRQLWTDIGVD